MTKELTIKECIKGIQEFANKHKVIFEDEGECGFGRECVGLTNGSQWIAFNPYDKNTYEPLPEYHSDKFYEISPEDAYHKSDCIAVLGRGAEAIRQLHEWITKLDELNVVMASIPTGASDPITLMLQGTHTPIFMIK